MQIAKLVGKTILSGVKILSIFGALFGSVGYLTVWYMRRTVLRASPPTFFPRQPFSRHERHIQFVATQSMVLGFRCDQFLRRKCLASDVVFVQNLVNRLFDAGLNGVALSPDVMAVSITATNFMLGPSYEAFLPATGHARGARHKFQMVSKNVQVTYFIENGVEYVAGLCIYLNLADEADLLHKWLGRSLLEQQESLIMSFFARAAAEPYRPGDMLRELQHLVPASQTNRLEVDTINRIGFHKKFSFLQYYPLLGVLGGSWTNKSRWLIHCRSARQNVIFDVTQFECDAKRIADFSDRPYLEPPEGAEPVELEGSAWEEPDDNYRNLPPNHEWRRIP